MLCMLGYSLLLIWYLQKCMFYNYVSLLSVSNMEHALFVMLLFVINMVSPGVHALSVE